MGFEEEVQQYKPWSVYQHGYQDIQSNSIDDKSMEIATLVRQEFNQASAKIGKSRGI